VPRRPSSSETCGRQPSSCSMWETSSALRRTSPSSGASNRGGCPLPLTARQWACRSATLVSNSAAHVEDTRRSGCGERCGDHVVGVDEVARLAAVPEDHRFAALCHRLEKDRDHSTLEGRLLPRAVDVAEPQCRVAGALQAVPPCEVLLSRQLGDAVRGERPARVALSGRPLALAVDRAARSRRRRQACAGRRPEGRERCRRRSPPHRSRVAATRSERPPVRRGGNRPRVEPRRTRRSAPASMV
jgi:hypothetical protein